jgi:hypothetical protein
MCISYLSFKNTRFSVFVISAVIYIQYVVIMLSFVSKIGQLFAVLKNIDKMYQVVPKYLQNAFITNHNKINNLAYTTHEKPHIFVN